MSTRSEILVRCSYGAIKLYHHHDGYIEGVGFDLYKRFFNGDVPFSPNGIMSIDQVVNKLVKDKDDEYEITCGKHTDIEFYYVIDIDGARLTGYEAEYRCDKNGNSYLSKNVTYSMETIAEMYKEAENEKN